MNDSEKPAVIRFDRISIIFGDDPASALPLMDQGLNRSEIQKRTDQVLGVHDCSLDVAEGEIAVLMGLSGSGKSTLLRAVNGLNKVARGSMMVDIGDGGMVDVASADAKTLRKLRTERVSMVFQQFGLLPWRTVEENVGFGLELSGVPQKERHDRVMAQLETVGLAEWAQRKVHELSGGMQQRVGLARAFATEAPILLMDEPFSALDPLIRTKLQDELLELQRRLKRTIVFVSHDLDEAVKLGSKIAIMEGGRIVQSGRPEDIVLRPANDYVEEFVAHLNPLGVLCAEDVMRGGETGMSESVGASVKRRTPVKDMLVTMSDTYPSSVAVVENGAVVGVVSPKDVLDALVKRRPAG